MYKCLNCGFSLTSKMKHSIIKNMCPACGSKILYDDTINLCKKEIEEMSNNEFMRGIDKYMLQIISLYVVNKLKEGNKDDKKKHDTSELIVEDSKIEVAEDNYVIEESTGDLEDIRKQVENQVLKENNVLFEEEDEISSKVERLKEIAKNNALNKSGVQVRRVST